MKIGTKQFKTMEERRVAVIEEYKAMQDKPEKMGDFAEHLGISRAYLYKMGVSAPVLRNLVVDNL